MLPDGWDKGDDGIINALINLEENWEVDAGRIISLGEPPFTLRFNWIEAPRGWDPFGGYHSRGDILRSLNTAFESRGYSGRARFLSTDRICEIDHLSLEDLINDAD